MRRCPERKQARSSELLEPACERGPLGGDGAVRRGPESQEAAIADLFESTQVFFPIEGTGRKSESARVGRSRMLDEAVASLA